MFRLASFLLFVAALSAAPVPVPHGTVELISENRLVQPGSPFQTGLHFKLEDGWHIYWKNPGDSGQPPRVQWDLPNGIAAQPIDFPTPRRIPVGPLMDYGYGGEVLLPIGFEFANEAARSKSLDLKGHLRVLVCRESCIPGKAELSLSLPVSRTSAGSVPQNQVLFAAARAAQPKPLPSSWTATAQAEGQTLTLSVAGADASKAEFYPATPDLIENAAPQQSSYSGRELRLTLKRPVPGSTSTGSVPTRAEGLLIVTAPTEASYTLSAPLTSKPASPSATAPASTPLKPTGSFLPMIVFAFLGGLILNLMPCVFPVLSIKVLSLLKSGDSDSRPVANAIVYTIGIVLSLWTLVAVLLTLRSTGSHLGWGFQLQSPGFVAFLACFLFLFGLNMAGVFEIGQSVMGAGSGLTQKSGLVGSFFTGVLATVVATPCTAPFMGTAIAFALGQAPVVTFTLFTAMALGLAAPFLIMALVPRLARFLPRPGRWMETLKHFLAFPIFGTVIWLLWVFGLQVSVDGLVRLLAALLLLAFAVWIYGRWSQSRFAAVLALALVLVSFAYGMRTAASQPHETAGANVAGGLRWEAFTPALLETYRSSGKPVVIDFTAAWCLTCQVNERVAFRAGEVRDRLQRSGAKLLRADWTSYDPAITQTLAQFGRDGVPLYVFYGSQSGVAPVVLPDGVLVPSTVLNTMDKLKM